jgi:hypothetical protein
LFQASGDLEAFLQAFIKVGVDVFGVGFVGYEKDFDIAGGKLIDFGTSSCTDNPFNPPAVQLATSIPDPNIPNALATGDFIVPGGVLTLNIGPIAGARLYQTNVHDEDYTISHADPLPNDPSGEAAFVTAFGITQRYAGVKQIMGNGGDGNDVITIEPGVVSEAQLTAGDGDDQVTYLGNGNFKLTAGNGNDVVTGGHGYNYVRTGSGNSTLVGGDGTTATVPPPISWGQAKMPNGTLYVNDFAAGSGTNTLQGGEGLNHLVAGHGTNKHVAGKRDDYLEGDGGTSTFIAGSEHDTVRIVGGTNTVLWTVGNGNLDVSNADVLATNARQVSGSNGPDTFNLAPNGQMGGLDVQANAALIHWVGFINRVSIDGAGGHDTINVADMESSGVTDIGLNDGEALAPDGRQEVINVQGSPNNHTILVKTESAFLHPDNPIGGVMLVQTHPHYQIHIAVVNNEDTLNVFAKGANNTVNVQSNTGHTVIFADAGSDTYNVSSDAPADTGVLLDPPPQQPRPPFGLFGTWTSTPGRVATP